MVENGTHTLCTAFEGLRCIASGELAEVAMQAKGAMDRGGHGAVLIFDDATSEQIEVDFRGTADDVRNRLAAAYPDGPPVADTTEPADVARRGPGRPKLGVVAREVTLLPRHWEWLNSQPGGASVALRKLVEHARRVNESADRVRWSQEAAYRFMYTLGGDLPYFEEASRALFACDQARFETMVAEWPGDVRAYAEKLASAAFPNAPA